MGPHVVVNPVGVGRALAAAIGVEDTWIEGVGFALAQILALVLDHWVVELDGR